MRTRDPGVAIAEFLLETANEIGLKDVLDHVGVAVDVTRGYVGVLHEIDLPEPVIAGDAGSLTESFLSEAEAILSGIFEMAHGTLGTNDAIEISRSPGSLGQKIGSGKGKIRNRGGTLSIAVFFPSYGFQDFIGGSEQVLAIHFFPKPSMPEPAPEHTSSRSEDHADHKKEGGYEHDDGARRKPGKQRAE